MTFGKQDRVDGNHSIDGDSNVQILPLIVNPGISCPVEAIHDLVSRTIPDDDIIDEATKTNLMQQLNAIIGNNYYSSLRDTDEFGMTLLHLVAERHGMSNAFKAVLEVYQNFNVENCFGLLRRTEQGETPIQFLAYDEESFYSFFEHVEVQCPQLLQKRDFVCEVFLNLLLHFGENTDEFAICLRDLLTKYPNALDPGTRKVEEYGSGNHTFSSSSSSPSASIMDNHTTEAAEAVTREDVSCSSRVMKSLLHRYCEENIGGPDSKVLAVLLEEGKNRPTLMNGGLTYADLLAYSPLHNILQSHLLRKCVDISVEGKSEENWDCVDVCVSCVGVVPVYCASVIFFPMKFMTIGISQLEASCNFIIERYNHLLQNVSNDDLLHLYKTFAAPCNSLPFCGKLDALYYKRLFEVCFLEGQMHRINFNNENILYIAIRDNLDWWKGLRFIFKESGKAIADRSNEFELPAPLFAAAVGSNLDTIYELFRGDVGLFGEM